MTARCLPQEPTFAHSSEQEVWERLRDSLPGDALLVTNLRLVDTERDHEADLVVLLPNVGIVVLEVKGGSVWFGARDSHDESGAPHWWQSGGGVRRINPVEQARRTRYALRDYVEADDRWTKGHVAWMHAVVTPYSRFPDEFAAPDCPRWALHDRDDMADLATRVEQTARFGQQGKPAPTHEDVELVSEILRGRGFTGHDRNAEALERQAVADRLTTEQTMLLQVTRLLNRVEVRGGAGSGKTVLALAQAKQLTRGRADKPAQRVALLCYSIGLAEFLKRQVEAWPRRQRPAFVGTYEELGALWGVEPGAPDDSAYWENEFPRLMADAAVELEPGKRFDSFIVDESQDFADKWWTPLLRAMKDEVTGGLFVYSDERQRVFARFGHPPVRLVPLVLDHNLRNTRQIHEAFGPLAPTRMTSRGGDGAEVHFIPAETDRALEVADEAVLLLLDIGWHPSNIALMTTGHRHDVQVAETERLGKKGYWRTFWEDDEVFYGHVLGCKGLERPAVVLCLNERAGRDRSREKLYVGMSRATDHLIVVGDPEVVREIGGDAVAGRLRVG